MFDYVTRDVPELVEAICGHVPRWSTSGHSMGGHGALVVASRHPEQFASASAFAPIAHPVACPWGQRAFQGYLGEHRDQWHRYDTVTLMKAADEVMPMRIDQGSDGEFLSSQLGYDELVAAAARFKDRVRVARHAGYDHSDYFIATFIEAHLRFHACHLGVLT